MERFSPPLFACCEHSSCASLNYQYICSHSQVCDDQHDCDNKRAKCKNLPWPLQQHVNRPYVRLHIWPRQKVSYSVWSSKQFCHSKSMSQFHGLALLRNEPEIFGEVSRTSIHGRFTFSWLVLQVGEVLAYGSEMYHPAKEPIMLGIYVMLSWTF